MYAKKNNNKIIHFPNLHGLRFIAALLVIIHHTEQIKSIMHLPSVWENDTILLIGKLGVVLFFVLSGYLITYLLLEEKKVSGSISIRKFYLRRILRIWPLYYIVVLLSLFAFPQIELLQLSPVSTLSQNFSQKVLLLILFLPNLAIVLYQPVPYAAQTWSVGVEEQFYFIWPILVKYTAKPIIMLTSVIFIYLTTKILNYYIVRLPGTGTVFQSFSAFWDNFLIDCMAIGGVMAYLVHTKNTPILNFLYNRTFQFIIYILTLVLILLGLKIPFLHYEMYAVLFAVIITNLASNPSSIINLEREPLIYLGRISYGLYMFHPLAIVLSIKILVLAGIQNSLLIFLSGLTLTIILSGLSYQLIEKKFLRLKPKFSTVISG